MFDKYPIYLIWHIWSWNWYKF